VKKLHSICKERIKALLEKEKKRAKAMFATKGSSSSSSASTTTKKNIKKANESKSKEEEKSSQSSPSVQKELINFLNSEKEKDTKTSSNTIFGIPNIAENESEKKNYDIFNNNKSNSEMKDRIPVVEGTAKDDPENGDDDEDENYDDQGLEPAELMMVTLGFTAICFAAYQYFFRRRTV